jgi:hypothetical protein
MDERTGTIRLVEPAHDFGTRGMVATIPRSDVEQAMRSDGEQIDLLLDVERATSDGRETERIALGWEPQDLERLLETTDADEISLTFDEGELQSLLDEDVEAHGLRKSLAVLTVAAGMAAAGAGSAIASPAGDGALPGGTATPAAQVTASEVSTGLGTQQAATAGRTAAASEISTGVTAATPAAPSEVSTGITAKPTATPVSADDPSWSTGTTAGVALAGTILALTAVGFAMRTRRGPTVAT